MHTWIYGCVNMTIIKLQTNTSCLNRTCGARRETPLRNGPRPTHYGHRQVRKRTGCPNRTYGARRETPIRNGPRPIHYGHRKVRKRTGCPNRTYGARRETPIRNGPRPIHYGHRKVRKRTGCPNRTYGAPQAFEPVRSVSFPKRTRLRSGLGLPDRGPEIQSRNGSGLLAGSLRIFPHIDK